MKPPWRPLILLLQRHHLHTCAGRWPQREVQGNPHAQPHRLPYTHHHLVTLCVSILFPHVFPSPLNAKIKGVGLQNWNPTEDTAPIFNICWYKIVMKVITFFALGRQKREIRAMISVLYKEIRTKKIKKNNYMTEKTKIWLKPTLLQGLGTLLLRFSLSNKTWIQSIYVCHGP